MSYTRINVRFCKAVTIRFLLAYCLMLFGAGHAFANLNPKFYPNVPLINQDGETLHFYDDVIKGKVVTINFMFTSCGYSCPLETAKLREVQKRLGDHVGKNVYMYSITVDPDRDTPEVLKAYMKKFKVGPGWQFLTGKKEDIDMIRKKLGLYVEGQDELTDHSISLVLGNEATGRWLKRTPFDVPEALVTTLLGRMQTRSLLSTLPRLDYKSAPKLSNANPGSDLFVTRCNVCHTIGEGTKVGPDLLGVAANRDHKWLVRWLMEPDVMLKEKDPIATALYEQYGKVPMPNITLSEQQALDLIEFMDTESKRISEQSSGLAIDQTSPLTDQIDLHIH
jgi:protein SCO1/2